MKVQFQTLQVLKGSRGLRLLLSLFFLLALAGCAGEVRLRPAPSARLAPGEKKAALAESAGVRMVVNGDAWSGFPGTLDETLTPVRVNVDNASNWPLRIRYDAFTLTSLNGITVAALPPYRIEATAPNPSPPPAWRPGFVWRRYYLAPYYRRAYAYSGLLYWDGPFSWDSSRYANAWSSWPVQLPTSDMLEKAIPEGVLQSDGMVAGFLYFPKISRDVRQVEFRAKLINAETGADFGTITIPFVVK